MAEQTTPDPETVPWEVIQVAPSPHTREYCEVCKGRGVTGPHLGPHNTLVMRQCYPCSIPPRKEEVELGVSWTDPPPGRWDVDEVPRLRLRDYLREWRYVRRNPDVLTYHGRHRAAVVDAAAVTTEFRVIPADTISGV